MSTIGKSIETENKVMLVQNLEKLFSFGDLKNVL
jgi:hypothetical protein